MERAVPAQHLGNGLAAPGNALGDTGNGLSPGLQVVDVHNREACLAQLTGQLRPLGVHCDSPLGYQHINAGPGGGDTGDPVGDDGQPGTDFTVGLMPEAQFCGGGEESIQGVFYNPNIPTEECFTSPKRGLAEGIVYATKPLSYQGQLIEGFSIRFAGGKAVEVHAEKNEELLKTMISMDEGAAYLGECALVPQSSPIAQCGYLFYNTLFDENAACHLALGMGYADTIRDFQNKTLEECRSYGINDSMIHEDFMIGCDSMNIDAHTRDGRVVPIFRNGNWAF